jgi:hypothetical protein
MNYFPNIDKIRAISDILQHDNINSKSKLEYLVWNYLVEDYKVFDNTRDYWKTTSMIVNGLTSKDFNKLIKRGTANFIHSKIDELIIGILLQRSKEKPQKKAAIDTLNPDLLDDEPFRIVSN